MRSLKSPLTVTLWLFISLAISLQNNLVQAENAGFVSVSGRNFILDGRDFYFNGANQYYLFYKPQAMIDEVLQDASDLGLNVLRIWGFCDGVWIEGHSFQPAPGIYNENTFQKMDYIIYKANQLNIRLIISLVNSWDDFGGMNKYVEWSSAATHDDFYSDEQCKGLYKSYLQYFLNRRNTYTQTLYKDEPGIMIWELANEPRCQTDPTGDTLYNWIEEMAAYLKSIDSNHLVSSGGEGWYKDKGSDWKYNGSQGVDFIRNSQCAYIDACSFHLYPKNYIMSESESLLWIDEHIDDAHFSVGKPVYLGEFGWEAPREIIGDFSVGKENWKVDWGYSASYPQRVASPSQNSNGAIVFYPSGSLGRNQAAAGERWFSYPDDFSKYQRITAWVYIPSSAPEGMKADIYTKSGADWMWSDGYDYSLTPGSWTELSFNTSSIFDQGQVRSVGIRVTNGRNSYTGPIYYDSIVAASETIDSGIEDRDSIYTDWYDALNAGDSDGALFWILSGHQQDSTFYPDYDNYTIYSPEDFTSCQIVKSYSDIVAGKNLSTPVDQAPETSIQNPQSGRTVSGTVLIQTQAADDYGISSVTYAIDVGAERPMSPGGADIWQAEWDSTVVSDGSHTITVTATDTAAQSNTDQISVNVDNVISETALYVKNIDLTLRKRGINGIKKQCFASVGVVDTQGNPVHKATVYTYWSGLVSDSDISVTDRNGLAKNISSDEAQATTGTFRITIGNIIKDGYIYEPSLNAETYKQIQF